MIIKNIKQKLFTKLIDKMNRCLTDIRVLSDYKAFKTTYLEINCTKATLIIQGNKVEYELNKFTDIKQLMGFYSDLKQCREAHYKDYIKRTREELL